MQAVIKQQMFLCAEWGDPWDRERALYIHIHNVANEMTLNSLGLCDSQDQNQDQDQDQSPDS